MRLPVVAGAVVGFVLYAVHAVGVGINLLLHPSIAERATGASVAAMLAYAVVFVAAGALAGRIWALRGVLLRYASIGALAGAVVWSYLTVTWPLTARASAVAAPQLGAPGAILVGAVLGALGGLLLYCVVAIRRKSPE